MSVSRRAIRRAFGDFRRHPWLHLVSISTIAVSLIVLGGFLILFRNLEHLAQKTSPQATGTLYLKDGLTAENLKSLQDKILSLENVEKVTYKPKSSVIEELHGFVGGQETHEFGGAEFFPDILEVGLNAGTSPAGIAALKEILSTYTDIAEIDFSEDWVAQYRKVRSLLGIFGLVLLVSMLVGCSFITANFMGIRYQSRREEIDIVRLVGADRLFVMSPFVMEGLVEGMFGALLSIGALYLIATVFSTALNIQWASIFGIEEWLFLSPWQVLALVFLGMSIACLGSVTVFLRFQRAKA